MKDLIKQILREETEEVLEIPGFGIFPDRARDFLKFIKKHGHKKWSFGESLDLYSNNNLSYWWRDMDYYGLDNLVGVGGELDLFDVRINNLNSLKFVYGDLDIRKTDVRSLGNLEYVGGNLKVPYPLFQILQSDVETGKLRVMGDLKYF